MIKASHNQRPAAARVRARGETEAQVMLASRRRCCLCVGLERDYRVKRLQIAHIDRNPSHSQADNLVPLCLPHHDEYDSRSRHTKALRPLELRYYRDAWTFEAGQRYAEPLSIDVRPGPNRTLRSIIRRHPVFRAYRRLATGDVAHQLLQIQLHSSHLTVLCTEWISVGPLRGLQFIGSFKCYRGSSSRDRGTHDLSWNGTEFVGGARFDDAGWGSDDIVWRPLD
jgi:hypothetical protein